MSFGEDSDWNSLFKCPWSTAENRPSECQVTSLECKSGLGDEKENPSHRKLLQASECRVVSGVNPPPGHS